MRKMNSGTVLRVVALACVSVFAIGVLIYGLATGFGLKEFRRFGFQKDFTTPYEYTKEADELTEIDITWLAGPVTLSFYNGPDIRVTEIAQRDLSESEQLSLSLSRKKLDIRWNSSLFNLFGFWHSEAKSLEVQIPRQFTYSLESVRVSTSSGDIVMDDLTVEKAVFETVSGELQVRNISAEEVQLKTTSGDIVAENVAGIESFTASTVSGEAQFSGIQAGKFEFKTTSGDLVFGGTAEGFKGSAVSGELDVTLSNWPAETKLDSVSGDIAFRAPSSPEGFTCKFKTVSGDFKSAFATQKSDDTYICGDGTLEMKINTTSGDVILAPTA